MKFTLRARQQEKNRAIIFWCSSLSTERGAGYNELKTFQRLAENCDGPDETDFFYLSPYPYRFYRGLTGTLLKI